jgi:hypothetical protein
LERRTRSEWRVEAGAASALRIQVEAVAAVLVEEAAEVRRSPASRIMQRGFLLPM